MRLPSSIFRSQAKYLICALMILGGLVGCAGLAPTGNFASLAPSEKACLSEFLRHDNAVSTRHVNDAQFARIPGYPFLRVNRLLASLRMTLDSREKQLRWLERLASLDHEARYFENKNLPAKERENLAVLNDCRRELVEYLGNSPADLKKLLHQATVEDNYSTSKRLAGIYPLSRWAVFNGVLKLHSREKPFPAMRATETTRLYSSRIIASAQKHPMNTYPPRDSLGFPELSEEDVEGLMRMYAPVWAVETRGGSDFPGLLQWSDEKVVVAQNSPVEYQHISYTLLENQPLLQLMYTVWFPEVPATSAVDIYAGELDGLTFRVTLDNDFKPLLVDVMHNCGCYYMAFPSSRLSPAAVIDKFNEPLWIPFELRAPNSDERYVVQLGSGNHFLMGLSVSSSTSVTQKMSVLPYDRLRSLVVAANKNRSVFSPRGLIENSHRLERYVLWPMGVLSAGAMRQSGHHAIAFVGRRHFDDPALITDYFVRR